MSRSDGPIDVGDVDFIRVSPSRKEKAGREPGQKGTTMNQPTLSLMKPPNGNEPVTEDTDHPFGSDVCPDFEIPPREECPECYVRLQMVHSAVDLLHQKDQRHIEAKIQLENRTFWCETNHGAKEEFRVERFSEIVARVRWLLRTAPRIVTQDGLTLNQLSAITGDQSQWISRILDRSFDPAALEDRYRRSGAQLCAQCYLDQNGRCVCCKTCGMDHVYNGSCVEGAASDLRSHGLRTTRPDYRDEAYETRTDRDYQEWKDGER